MLPEDGTLVPKHVSYIFHIHMYSTLHTVQTINWIHLFIVGILPSLLWWYFRIFAIPFILSNSVLYFVLMKCLTYCWLVLIWLSNIFWNPWWNDSPSNVYTATEWKDILEVRLVCLGLLTFQHLKVGCQFIGWFHAVVNAHSSWTRMVVKRYMHYLPICFACGNAILVAKQITNLSHPVHQVETDFLCVCV